MTNELEKQFFDTFGIEPKLPDYNEGYCDGCEIDDDKCESNCPHKARITPEILLELICICSIYEKSIDCCYWVIGKDIETLKKNVLEDCMDYVKDIKHQVRTLFEEG